MNWWLFIALIFGLQLFCLVVSRKVSKGLKTNADYFLASRTVRFFPLMMTLVATQIGGGLVLGAAQEAYTYGWSVILYPLGQSLGFILLAAGIGKKMAESGASTVAELCERAFKSRNLRQVASILSIVSLFMIFVAQVLASQKFMVSLGVDQLWMFLLFWALIIVYTVMGGLKGVIATDIVQALFFIVVFILALLFAQVSLGDVFAQSLQLPFEADSTPKMVGWLVMPMLFMVIEQDMGQRCFAADAPGTVTSAAFISALVTITVCTIPVFFGVMAKTLDLPITAGGSVFMTVIKSVTNPSITAFVACAVVAAIISTAISLINAISSNLTQDFNWKSNREGGSVRVAQAITTAIALAGLGFSFYFNNIVDILIQSYDLSISCLLVPVLVALLKGRGSALSAWLSFGMGAATFFLFRLIPSEVPRELLTIFFSGLGYLAGEWFLRQKAASQHD